MTRRSTHPAVALLALAALLAVPAAAATYELDTAHTSVTFGVKHMTVSTVHGRFNEVSGTAEVDESDLSASSIEVTIQAASIDTDNADRDGHLRSDDFFDVENHPTITFVSKAIEPSGGDEYEVTGDLTIRGTTREVTFPATLVGPVEAGGAQRIGVEAELTIDRHDYGVAFSRLLEGGGLVVGNEVDIRIGAELTAAGE